MRKVSTIKMSASVTFEQTKFLRPGLIWKRIAANVANLSPAPMKLQAAGVRPYN